MASVSGVSTSLNQYQVDWQNNLKQWQQNFSQLGTALQSGDLAGAQAAFSALLQNTPASSPTQTSQQGGATGIKADFDALGQALQSGDVDAAKTAFTKLQQDLQTARAHHHHHHHGQATGQSSSANSVADLLETASGGNSSSDGRILNVSA